MPAAAAGADTHHIECTSQNVQAAGATCAAAAPFTC